MCHSCREAAFSAEKGVQNQSYLPFCRQVIHRTSLQPLIAMRGGWLGLKRLIRPRSLLKPIESAVHFNPKKMDKAI